MPRALLIKTSEFPYNVTARANNNHIHLIISTPLENIDQAMRYFMTMTSKEIGARANRINENRSGFDIFIPDNESELIAWINQDDDPLYTEEVRKALKKKIFKFSNTNKVKKHEDF